MRFPAVPDAQRSVVQFRSTSNANGVKQMTTNRLPEPKPSKDEWDATIARELKKLEDKVEAHDNPKPAKPDDFFDTLGGSFSPN